VELLNQCQWIFVLIEPYRNWNFSYRGVPPELSCLNRTISELKRVYIDDALCYRYSLNRTISELKPEVFQGYKLAATVLIEPYRNWNGSGTVINLYLIIVLIEPYRNWNNKIPKKYQSGFDVLIEPYRNWNKTTGHYLRDGPQGLNRTISELKQNPENYQLAYWSS